LQSTGNRPTTKIPLFHDKTERHRPSHRQFVSTIASPFQTKQHQADRLKAAKKRLEMLEPFSIPQLSSKTQSGKHTGLSSGCQANGLTNLPTKLHFTSENGCKTVS